MQKLTPGTAVEFRDENGLLCSGTIVAYEQANDGTGRWGYSIRFGRTIYWRAETEVERAL